MDWYGQTLTGHAPAGKPVAKGRSPHRSGWKRSGSMPIAPKPRTRCQGTVIAKTFLGSRMALDLRVEGAQGAVLKAYVDNATGQSLGSDPVWVGWDSDAMAVLAD